MSRRNLSPIQFSDLRYEKDISGGMGSIEAHHPDPSIGQIGTLYWNTDPKYKAVPQGGITSIAVHEDFRRQGLATHMYNMAKEMDSTVQHGPVTAQTPLGKKWAKATP